MKIVLQFSNIINTILKVTMKKLLAFLAIVMLFVIILSSCKGHELCPAYGKADSKPKTEKQV